MNRIRTITELGPANDTGATEVSLPLLLLLLLLLCVIVVPGGQLTSAYNNISKDIEDAHSLDIDDFDSQVGIHYTPVQTGEASHCRGRPTSVSLDLGRMLF